MNSKARKLHAVASQKREEGKLLESLQANDEALLEYDLENDDLGFAEGIACRAITLRVFANLNNSRKLLILAKHEMLAAIEIAKKSGQKESLAMPLFNLAEVREDLEEYSEAAETYKEAIKNFMEGAPKRHDRLSVLANMNMHLWPCAYKAGDKNALSLAEKALSDLQNAEEKKYNKDVWISGGYMRMASAIANDNAKKAREYMQKAREIIDSNPDLTVRKKQWEKLNSKLLLSR